MLNVIKNFFKPKILLNVAYDSGGKNKPTIVLLHGIAASSATWVYFLEQIDTKKYRVITIDLLGFGKSPVPQNIQYAVEDHTKAVKNTLKKLKIHQPFSLFGHSMGSIISLHYAYKHPNRVAELYLLSLPMYLHKNNTKGKIAKHSTDIYMKAYELIRSNPKFTLKHSKRLRTLLKLPDGIDVTEKNWIAFERSLKNTIETQGCFDELETLTTPTHIMYGSLDEFAVPGNYKQISNKSVRVEKIRGVDHVISNRYAKQVVNVFNKN